MRLEKYFTMCLTLLAACAAPSFNEGDYGDSDEPEAMRGMVAAHNETRAEAEPTPSPALEPLAWSSTLAEVAQAYAERCRFEHSGNDLGENLYAESGITSTAAAVVASWASELAFYNYANNSCAVGEQCGHYTQIVWDDTRRVGCGRARCTSNSPFDNGEAWNNWVCNYDPPGNFVGRRPY
ncbi:MAG: CAP domain-containing protein [Myxococcota bacterium]